VAYGAYPSRRLGLLLEDSERSLPISSQAGFDLRRRRQRTVGQLDPERDPSTVALLDGDAKPIEQTNERLAELGAFAGA